MEDAPTPLSLLSNPDDGTGVTDISLPSKYRDKLDNSFDTLLNDVDLNIILPKCREKRVITHEHYENLWEMVHSGRTRQAKSDFVTVLPSRGRQAYLWFCYILRTKSEQKFLYDLLVDAEAETLIKDLLENDPDEKEQMLGDGFDAMMTSPPPTPSHGTPTHDESEQTVPKILDAPYRHGDTTTSPVQAQDGEVERDGPTGPTERRVPVVTRLFNEHRGAPQVPSQTAPSEPKTPTPLTPTNGNVPPQNSDGKTENPTLQNPDNGAAPLVVPEWVRGLRDYQKELAEPGIQGHNYIICAPTGSGKTRAAAYVVYHHLQRVGEDARVVFFAPTVALVRQQYAEFKEWFSAQKVDYIVGPDAEEKPSVEVMIKYNQITVITPAIFYSALRDGRIQGLHLVSMMIFDECHHTHGDNIYNKIMGKHVDRVVEHHRGDPGVPGPPPQIIGMTASLGVGDAKADESAVQFVLQKCANLDAREIAVVKIHKEELGEHVNEPTEEMKMIPSRVGDPFSKTILHMMQHIEQEIRRTEPTEKVALADLEFPEKKDTMVYLSYLSNVHWKIASLPAGIYARRKVLSCLEYLTCYYTTLTLHDEARAKDALNLLQRMFELRADTVVENDPTEKWLRFMYTENWEELKIISENPEYGNPKLSALKRMILDAFTEEPDTYAILFTKTKMATEALMNWCNEDPDLKHLKAVRITGASNEMSAGMTSKTQQNVVQHFKLGKSRLLIATSVAEEGLDIKACNCVFRYNYSTNEIGRVQAKGRARSKKSSYRTITSDDKSHLEEKEKMNLYREGLMRNAVYKISIMDREQYGDQVFRYQSDAYRDRRFKEFLRLQKQKNKSQDTFLAACFKCDTIVCKSTDIVLFQETHYTCVNEDIEQLFKVRKHRQVQKFGAMERLNRIYCKDCQWDWGSIVKYKSKIYLPLLKAAGFAFFKMLGDGGRGERVSGPSNKKWDDAPCAFNDISEEDVFRTFRSKEYPPEY